MSREYRVKAHSPSTSTSSKHRIVIVGGGISGLECISQLMPNIDCSRVSVTLIDQNLSHVWKPNLPNLAVGNQNLVEDIPYHAHAKTHGYQFRLGTMQSIDRELKYVLLAPLTALEQPLIGVQRIPYDTLILAVGSSCDINRVPGAVEHCHFLNTRRQAERVYRALLQLLSHQDINRPLRLSVIGSSTAGIELAMNLQRLVADFCRHYPKFKLPVVQLIEPQHRIAPHLPPFFAQHIAAQLQDVGVQLYCGEHLSEVGSTKIILQKNHQIASDFHVWTRNTQAAQVTHQLSLSLNAMGKIRVNEFLQSIDDTSVYALGHCADLPVTQAFTLSSIQLITKQAEYLANSLPQAINREAVETFDYRCVSDLERLAQLATIIYPPHSKMPETAIVAPDFYQLLYRRHQAVIFGHDAAKGALHEQPSK